jgi:hypothetical protein
MAGNNNFDALGDLGLGGSTDAPLDKNIHTTSNIFDQGTS